MIAITSCIYFFLPTYMFKTTSITIYILDELLLFSALSRGKDQERRRISL
jgi:hypothetical protein